MSTTHQPAGTWTDTGPSGSAGSRWRTRDITVVAVIAAAFGVVFVAWNVAWEGTSLLFAFFPPLQYVLYPVWLVPPVLAALIVRKPGAALFAELVAAGISMVVGSQWGVDTLFSGFVQGAAAELVFAFTLYRNYSWPVLALAALATAAAAWVHDWVVYYAATSVDVVLLFGLFMAASTVIVVPAASILIVRSLRRAGVLEGFPA